jgi:hypothetical protein
MTRVLLSSNQPVFSANINFNSVGPSTFSLESLSVPETYYNIYSNQTILFTDLTNITTDIIFTEGNYTVLEFLTELTERMTNIDPVGEYAFEQNVRTRKWEISVNALGTFELQFPELISKYFGFGFIETSHISNIGILLLGIDDFTRTKHFYISNSCSMKNGGTFKGRGGKRIAASAESDLIACVPYKSALETTQFSYYGTISHTFETGILNRTWNIRIEDEEGYPIEMNGHNWTIVLIIKNFNSLCI